MYQGQIKEFISRPDYRCIVQMDMDGNYIKSYVVLKEATRQALGKENYSGNIIAAINGKSRHCMGYKWRYGTPEETQKILEDFKKEMNIAA